jgi:hypothetical protein
MPVPFAHPAAVLPLKRIFSRWVHFPALVIGSLVPDAGYVFERYGMGDLSHQFLGSIVFGFPVGILMLVILYTFRRTAVSMLPSSLKRTFLPLCARPVGPLWIVATSLLAGIWLHVFWDSFTHGDGWITEHLLILQTPVLHFGSRTARVCHLLWYGSSFAGVTWLYRSFDQWRLGTARMRDAAFFGILIVPISLMHHLIRGTLGMAITAVLCLLLALGFIFRTAATA